MDVTLTFLGGAQTVTGSKFLVETEGRRVLVDCGLFQGLKELRLKNWAPLPIEPKTIDAVIITHAHLDHVGYLPLLVRNGFAGPVFATAPTQSLADILLLDASHIQEEDAKAAAKGGYSKHPQPAPLFTISDVNAAMTRFRTVPLEKWEPLFGNVRFRLIQSGHILGSAFVEIEIHRKRLLFTGDLGRQKPLILHPPKAVAEADYLILESTYGEKRHPKEPVLKTLARHLTDTISAGGSVFIPSFAVGRSQDILHLLAQLKRQKQLPQVPIFFDGPMGIQATKILSNFPEWHRLHAKEMKDLCDVAALVNDTKHSTSLSSNRKQKIVIAGSGMLTGGRILNYLEKALPDKRNLILLTGYQPTGTRGRLLQDGVPELKVHGGYIDVKARVEAISGLSAHADQAETLAWLRNFKRAPRKVFLVHGEPQPCEALRVKIEDALGWQCHIPHQGERIALGE